MKSKTSPCPKCGAPIKINTSMIKSVCEECGTTLIIDDITADEVDESDEVDVPAFSKEKSKKPKNKITSSTSAKPRKSKSSNKNRNNNSIKNHALLFLSLISILILITLFTVLFFSKDKKTAPVTPSEPLIEYTPNSTILEYELD